MVIRFRWSVTRGHVIIMRARACPAIDAHQEPDRQKKSRAEPHPAFIGQPPNSPFPATVHTR
jgi:hypothetical protein